MQDSLIQPHQSRIPAVKSKHRTIQDSSILLSYPQKSQHKKTSTSKEQILHSKLIMADNETHNDGQHARRKTKEELDAEQQAAKEQLQAILDSSR